MTLSTIRNRDSVLAAVREFDKLGRERFLTKYGFGHARNYIFVIGHKHYDSKAIMGAAHGYEFPKLGPLTSASFSGGEATVAKKLKGLGFKVKRLRDKSTLKVKPSLNYWIFQGNPKQFEVDRYVQGQYNIVWSVRQNSGIMRLNDTVFIWRSAGQTPGTAAIIARAKITSMPSMMPDNARDLWVRIPKRLVELRVRLRVIDRLDSTIELKREELLKDPLLSKMRIIRFKTGTNFPLTKEQAEHIEMLCRLKKVVKQELDQRYSQEDAEDSTFQSEVQKAKRKPRTTGPLPKPVRVPGSGGTGYRKDAGIAKGTLEDAGFKCEVDKKHKTFTSRTTGRNFVEAHHLIPMEFQDKFDYSLDVSGNIVSLCPNCHRLLHHARMAEKQDILKMLHRLKQKVLKRHSVGVDEKRLKRFYT